MVDSEGLLATAEQLLCDGDLRNAWRVLDQYASNYPTDAGHSHPLWMQARERSHETDLIGRTSIATWPEWALAAVSVTFDDRLSSHVDVVRPDLDRRRIPGTFFVIREHPSLPPLDQGYLKKWQSLADSRHEIGNHSDTHSQRLPDLDRTQIVEQLENCDLFIQSLHPVKTAVSFSYPYGLHGSQHGPLRNEVRRRYLVGRSSDNTRVGPNRSAPPEMNVVHSYSLMPGQQGDGVRRKLDQSAIERGWMIFTLHKVAQGEGYGDIGHAAWTRFLDTLEQARDRVWFGTTGDVARYIHCRVSAIVHCDRTSENELRLAITSDWASCERDRMPLDVSVRVPSRWKQASFTAPGRDGCQVRVEQNRVRATVFPDGQTCTIRRIN
jgi:peptidoglycan/xylan/chitin deacetylase (PgdA/CDA1 family)